MQHSKMYLRVIAIVLVFSLVFPSIPLGPVITAYANTTEDIDENTMDEDDENNDANEEDSGGDEDNENNNADDDDENDEDSVESDEENEEELEEEPTSSPSLGNFQVSDFRPFSNEPINISDGAELKSLIESAQGETLSIILTDNVSISSAIYMPDDSNITISSSNPGEPVEIIQAKSTTSNAETRHFIVNTNTTSALTLNDIVLQSGPKLNSGVHIYSGASFTLEGNNSSTITGSTTYSYGGAIRMEKSGTVKISGMIIEGNAATVQGGAISIENTADVILDNLVIKDNSTPSNGGGVFVSGASKVKITDTEISGNSANTGAGIYAANTSVVTVDGNSIISGNTAKGNGGGVFSTNNSVINISNSQISGNRASANGGGAFLAGQKIEKYVFENVTVTDNHAVSGGGIYINIAETILDINNSKITSNTAKSGGGGIYIGTNQVNISNTEISGNKSDTNGGGIIIYVGGIKISNGTVFNGNEAKSDGGAIYTNAYGVIDIQDSEFINNKAGAHGGAVGIYKPYADMFWKYTTAENTTFSDNEANGFISIVSDEVKAEHDKYITASAFTNGANSAYNNFDITNPDNPFTVKYDLNGGTYGGPAAADNNSYGSGAKAEITDIIPVRTGYAFKGWSKTTAGTELYNVGESVSITNNTTLYAIWEESDYIVTFDLNGILDVYEVQFTSVPGSDVFKDEDGKGYLTVPHSINETDIGTILSQIASPTQYGHEFKGWYTKNGGKMSGNEYRYNTQDSDWGEEVTAQYLADNNANITVYARWGETAFPVANETQLHIAVSSNRDVIDIEITADIQLKDAIRAERMLDNAVINMKSSSSGSVRKLTQTANTRHLYMLSGGRNTVMNLTDITADTTSGYGGVEVASGKLTLKGSNFVLTGSENYSHGGALYAHDSGHLSVEGMTIDNNEASQYGGGLYVYNGTVELTDVDFTNNTAGYGGGAIAARGSSSAVTYNDGTVQGNKAHFGGGVLVSKDSMTNCSMSNISFIGNIADEYINVLNENDTETQFFISKFKDNNISSDSLPSISGTAIAFTTNADYKAFNNYDISYTGEIFTIEYVLGENTTESDPNHYAPGAEIIWYNGAPTKTYYTFVGWSEDPEDTADSDNLYTEGSVINKDLTLYPIYKQNTATVTFKAGAGQFAGGTQQKVITVNLGEPIDTDDIPDDSELVYDTDHYFAGWYKEGNSSQHYDFGTDITGDLVLVADWQNIIANSHYIVFHSNGGSHIDTIVYAPSAPSPVDLTANAAYTEPVRTGYIFDGWYTLNSTGNISSVVDITNIILGDESFNGNTLHLYADWTAINYNLTFDIIGEGKFTYKINTNNPETITATNASTFNPIVTVEDTITLLAEAAEGSSFAGWTISAGLLAATPKANPFKMAEVLESTNITAEFAVNKYNVYFYNEAGNPRMADLLSVVNGIEHGTEITKTTAGVPKLESDSKVFKYWADENDSAESRWNPLDGDLTVESDLALYAFMEDKSFTVTYKFNYSSSPSDITESVTYGDKAENKVPERPYYTFGGWSVEGTKNLWNFEDSIVQDLILEAVWKEKSVPAPEVDIKIENAPLKTEITVLEGESVKITADGTVTDPYNSDPSANITYQWYRGSASGTLLDNSTAIAGNDNELGLSDLTQGTYEFYCEAIYENTDYPGNTTASAVSDSVTVHVDPIINAIAPILEGPDSITVHQYDPIDDLTISIYKPEDLGGDLTYQWYDHEETPISGAATDSLKVSSDVLGTFMYYVEVTHTDDSVNGEQTATAKSPWATVTVNPRDTFTVNYHSSNAHSGNVPSDPKAYEDGDTVTVLGNTGNLTRYGYEFIGWRLESASKIYNAGDVLTINLENLNFYAAWNKLPDTDDSGNTDGSNNYDRDNKDDKTTPGKVITAPEETAVPPAEEEDKAEPNLSLESEEHVIYLQGYEDGTVRPDGRITRAETASIFYRLITSEMRDNLPDSNPFTDVDSNAWYYEAVSFLHRYHILNGYEDGSFEPDRQITRAEFAAIASQFGTMREGNYPFTDINGEHWASAYISNMYSRGWIAGYEDNTFRPDEYITRAEAVTIINRMLGRQTGADETDERENPYSDISKDHWAYSQIIDASTQSQETQNFSFGSWK